MRSSRLAEGPVHGPDAAQDAERGTPVRTGALRRGGGGASRRRQGGAGVGGDHRSDGGGCDATGGVQNAAVAHLHAAHRQDMWEEPGHQRQDVEARGAWTGTAWWAGGKGDAALVQADAAPGGAGHFAARGRQGWQGGGALGRGLAVDGPWGGPDVWGELCKLSGSGPLWCEARAGARGQRAHGASAVGACRHPGSALLGEAAARDEGMPGGRRGPLSSPGRHATRTAGPRRADAARVCGQACEGLGRGREPALGGQPGLGAAHGAQRCWPGEGEQAVRPRQRGSALVVQPLRGLLLLTVWTVSMAPGRGAVGTSSSPRPGIAARAVGAGAAAAESVKGLRVRGREIGRGRDRLWGVGGENVAQGDQAASLRMIAGRRWTASAGPVCVRGREIRVVARWAGPMDRCMARRLTPASRRGGA